jgi:hypothetical protein
MTSELNDTAVAYTNFKHAALYFRHVIPDPSFLILGLIEDLYVAVSEGRERQDIFEAQLKRFSDFNELDLNRVLPESLKRNKRFLTLLKKVPAWDVLNCFLEDIVENYDPPREVTEKFVASANQMLGISVAHENALDVSRDVFMSDYKLNKLPAIEPIEFLKIKQIINKLLNRPAPPNDWRVTLSEINLIDTSTASWDQIFELREDSASQEKLCRLRYFFTTEFEGKDKAYIEADLHQRIEDYRLVVEKFGFEKKQTMFEALFSSNWVKGIPLGIMSGALFDFAPEALLAGVATVALEYADVKLKMRRQQFEFHQLSSNHPLAFIIETEQKLQK